MKYALFTYALLLAASVDAGTDKTQEPTDSALRPTMSPVNPPITPFPTPGTDEPTPEPTPAPVRLSRHFVMNISSLSVFASHISLLCHSQQY